jgi:hypothetical protein
LLTRNLQNGIFSKYILLAKNFANTPIYKQESCQPDFCKYLVFNFAGKLIPDFIFLVKCILFATLRTHQLGASCLFFKQQRTVIVRENGVLPQVGANRQTLLTFLVVSLV